MSDPLKKINGLPPKGKIWWLIEAPVGEPWSTEGQAVDWKVGDKETKEEKQSRLLREAAALIRKGTQPNAIIGNDELRTGLIKIAESLEVE